MKGQGAVAYVIIVGLVAVIALLVVSNLGSLNLFGFGSSASSRVNDISNLLKDVSVKYVLDENGSLQFSIKTTSFRSARDVLLVVLGPDSKTCNISFNSVSTNWVSGSNNCSFLSGSSGSQYDFNASVSYIDDSGLRHNAKGDLVGAYESAFYNGFFTGFSVVTEDINASGYNVIGDNFIGDNFVGGNFIGNGALLTDLHIFNLTYHDKLFNSSGLSCSGSDKLDSVSLSDGVLSAECSPDLTGGSSGFVPSQYNPVIKRQLSDLSSNSNSSWSVTDLVFDLFESTNYYLYCNILYTGAAATTGQVINLSTNASTSNVNIVYDTWSSATASVGLSSTVFGTALIGTGSGATITRPNLVIADFNAVSNGSLSLHFRSEVLGSDITVKRGSVCQLYNVSRLQNVPVSNVTDVIPAMKRQGVDVSTTNNTVWSGTGLFFDVDSDKSYSLKCDLLYTGAAATTGQVINLSTNASTSNVNIVYDTWSSATASVGLSATAFGTALTGTGSGATIVRPNLLMADFSTLSSGVINVTIRSEVAASATTLLRGSMCYLYDVT